MMQPFVRLMELKQWADRGIYQAIARSLPRLEEAEVAIMLRILDHMHAVDAIFQHHLRGVPHQFKAPRSERVPDLQALARSAMEMDDWYVSYVRGLADTELGQPVEFVFTSGRAARMLRSEIILHVCLHGTYHRGNAGAVLQLKGLQPSRDALTDFLQDAT